MYTNWIYHGEDDILIQRCANEVTNSTDEMVDVLHDIIGPSRVKTNANDVDVKDDRTQL